MELGFTQRDAALAAGVADQTWLNVERGEKVRERTMLGVDRALRWQPGSAQAVAEGGEPVETGGSDRTLEERVAVLEAELARVKTVVYGEQHDPFSRRPGLPDVAASRLSGLDDQFPAEQTEQGHLDAAACLGRQAGKVNDHAAEFPRALHGVDLCPDRVRQPLVCCVGGPDDVQPPLDFLSCLFPEHRARPLLCPPQHKVFATCDS